MDLGLDSGTLTCSKAISVLSCRRMMHFFLLIGDLIEMFLCLHDVAFTRTLTNHLLDLLIYPTCHTDTAITYRYSHSTSTLLHLMLYKVNEPNYIDISNFTSQNIAIAFFLLPQSVSLYYCVTLLF